MAEIQATGSEDDFILSLSNSNEVYQRMIDEIQDYAIILMDKNGIILNWNKGAEKIKLYKEEEIVGKHFSIFYLQEDLDRKLPFTLMQQASETGRALQEGWRKRKDGSLFWGSITITALHDSKHNVIGFSKVTRDLTDKKLIEDNLKKSEERYHQMIAEVQDYAIILLDADGVIQNWNAGAQSIKGYAAKEAIGKHFSIFYTDEDKLNDLPRTLLMRARETGKAVQEGWRKRKDGSLFWGSITITALHDKNNVVIGFSKVTRDLTEKKLADDQLLLNMAELEMQNSELEQFAYVASHDLQEPLRKIQTFAALIQSKADDKEFVKRYFKKLDAAAKRMSALVSSLLQYSRLGKDRSVIEEVDLDKIIQDVKQDFELLIEEKHAQIYCKGLPSVKGNAMQLGQLFSNLVSNSLKFSEKDVVINIEHGFVRKDSIPGAPAALADIDYLQVNVEDNGIGFEQEYDKVIFSLFQRLHGKEDYAGTGIGLALCKKIAENHQGFISAQSELNKGARFSVYLPVESKA